jgi:hypothetical protein
MYSYRSSQNAAFLLTILLHKVKQGRDMGYALLFGSITISDDLMELHLVWRYVTSLFCRQYCFRS